MSLRRRHDPSATLSFGRRAPGFILRGSPRAAASYISDDARLFALTFVGGFLFMAVYLG